MIDIAFIRENPAVIKKAAADKMIPVDIDRLLALDASLRELTTKIDALRSERNRISKRIPTCHDSKAKETCAKQVRLLKSELSELERVARNCRTELNDLF